MAYLPIPPRLRCPLQLRKVSAQCLRRKCISGVSAWVEVECKISEAINPRHYQTGFHSTATCGTFASASAAGKLMGLNHEAMLRALSIAGSQSAGLRENFGTMTKPFHAGRSSESGVVAAEFAEIGWTAAPISWRHLGDSLVPQARLRPSSHRGCSGKALDICLTGVSIKPILPAR